MANIFDVACYIIEKQPNITPEKLQELCFHTQGWMLGWLGRPMFEEDFILQNNKPVNLKLAVALKDGTINYDKNATKYVEPYIDGVLEHSKDSDKEQWFTEEIYKTLKDGHISKKDMQCLYNELIYHVI